MDAGELRDAPPHTYGYLSCDGRPPGDLIATVRAEVSVYGGELVTGIQLRPGRVKGSTGDSADPAARWDAGLEDRHPDQQGHPRATGTRRYEWIYVLSGHMCLVLGEKDWVLGPGEVASFDTKVPHWFGSTGGDPAEILSIFGRPGERITVRTTPP